MAKVTIVTHNGVFHADEVLAIALLKTFKEVDYEIIRTRDPKIISQADIVVDVGGEYDGESKFDHHQFSKEDEFFGLSSAGLIWKKIGVEYPSIATLVGEVDQQDVGIKRHGPHHFSNIISSFNDENINGEVQDQAFDDAVSFAERFVKNLKRADELKKAQEDAAAGAEVVEVEGVKIALLTKNSVFVPTANFVGLADISIQWDAGQNCWTVQTVPLEKGKFGSKFTLEPRGTEDEVFVHKGGFIAKIKEIDKLISFKVNGGGIIEISI